MLTTLLFAILLIPMIFQFIYGNKAVNGWISLKFWMICLISLIGQLLAIYIVFLIMEIEISNAGATCGLPTVGIIVTGMIFGVIMILIMVGQLLLHFFNK